MARRHIRNQEGKAIKPITAYRIGKVLRQLNRGVITYREALDDIACLPVEPDEVPLLEALLGGAQGDPIRAFDAAVEAAEA